MGSCKVGLDVQVALASEYVANIGALLDLGHDLRLPRLAGVSLPCRV